jgi:hypothetical protein
MSNGIDQADIQEKLRQGYLILDAFLTENGNLPTPELFRQCWKLILKNEELFAGTPTQGRRFNVDLRNTAYVRFSLFFKRLRLEFVPPVKLADNGPDINARLGSIFLTLHSNLELAIAKLLQGYLHHVAMISAGQRQPQLMDLFSLSPDLSIITRNSDCLLLAREALVKSNSLLIDVDYTIFDEERQRYEHKIGISAFLFAKKMSRPLYFVLPEITEDGETVCSVHLAQTDASANEIAEQFKFFARARTSTGDELSIGDWYLDTDGKANAKAAQQGP